MAPRSPATRRPHPLPPVRGGSAVVLLVPAILLVSCGDSGPTEPNGNGVGNVPPVPMFSGDVDQGPAPLAVTFDGSGSHDPDGEIVSWEWEFGDGATGTGETVSHVYQNPGYFFPRLTVTDNRGSSRTTVDSAIVVTAPAGEGDGSISGTVWHDRAGDGVRQAGDAGVPGAVVFLDLDGDGVRDPGEPYTVTDREGHYRFDGVDSAMPIAVTQELEFGWTNTFADGSAPVPAPMLAPEGPSLIIGGTPASEGEFPFMVALIVVGGSQNFFTCGGTFIAARWVLTAAHCVEGRQPSQLNVLAGTNTLNSGGEHVPVELIRIFPDYGANSFVGNDIALLRLDRDFMIPRSVLQSRDRPHLSAPGTVATAVGWGNTSFQGSISNELRKVQLPLISNSECQQMLDESVVAATICAGAFGTTQSICNGDSGGPLLVPDGEGWAQVGVTSFGRNCQPPLAWARVSELLGWVRSQVTPETSMSVTVEWAAGSEARAEFGNFR